MYLEQFCVCYLGHTAAAKNEEKKVVATPLWNTCEDKLLNYYSDYVKLNNYLNFVQYLKAKEVFDEKVGENVYVDGKKFSFCSKSQLNAWFRKYKNEQKDSIESLVKQVEIEFCDLKDNEKSSNKHKKCYEALIERSSKQEAEASCLSERDNKNKKIHENCIEMAQAIQILSTHSDKYSNNESNGSLKYKMEVAGRAAKSAKCVGDGTESGSLDCYNETLAKTGKDCQSPVFITTKAKDACVGLSLKEQFLALDPSTFGRCVINSSESKKPSQAVNDCLGNIITKSDLDKTDYDLVIRDVYMKLYPSKTLPK